MNDSDTKRIFFERACIKISFSIVDFHDPYLEAQLRGRVAERRPDGGFKYMDPISIPQARGLPRSNEKN